MFMGRRIISEHLTLVIKKKPRNATERQHVQITHEMSFEKKIRDCVDMILPYLRPAQTYGLSPVYHPAKRTRKNKRSN